MERMTHKARLRYWVEALHRCARECAERGITKQQRIAEQGVVRQDVLQLVAANPGSGVGTDRIQGGCSGV